MPKKKHTRAHLQQAATRALNSSVLPPVGTPLSEGSGFVVKSKTVVWDHAASTFTLQLTCAPVGD